MGSAVINISSSSSSLALGVAPEAPQSRYNYINARNVSLGVTATLGVALLLTGIAINNKPMAVTGSSVLGSIICVIACSGYRKLRRIPSQLAMQRYDAPPTPAADAPRAPPLMNDAWGPPPHIHPDLAAALANDEARAQARIAAAVASAQAPREEIRIQIR
jgi:hypothetical protein